MHSHSRVWTLIGLLVLAGCSGNEAGGPVELAVVISASPQSGTAPLEVSFTAEVVSGTAEAFSWDFGDGSEGATGRTITHEFVEAGDYTVGLTASGGESTVSATTVISVSAAAVGDVLTISELSADPNGGAAPLDVTLSATVEGGTPPYSYAWDLGDGADSTDEEVSHTYTEIGVHTVGLTVTDSAGDNASDSLQVAVGDADNLPPVAEDLEASTDEDTAVVIAADAADNEGASLTFSIDEGPESGTASVDGDDFTYTPEADFNGTDSFTYLANDGEYDSPAATVTITVESVNDIPSADSQTVSGNEDVMMTITLVGSDVETAESELTYRIVDLPGDGLVTGDGPDVEYMPESEFSGSDSFTYVVNDGMVDSLPATVSITVTAVNDNPEAGADTATTDEDTPVTLTDLLANDSDVESVTLEISAVGTAGAGVASLEDNGDVTYTPSPDTNGVDTFEYTVVDGDGGSAQGVVTLTVAAVNDDPSAVADTATTDEEVLVTIDVLSNDDDVDGDSPTIVSVTSPSDGITAVNAGKIDYTPDTNFTGSDSFDYTISDGNGGSASATVTVTVNEVNDPPYITNEGELSLSPLSPALSDTLSLTTQPTAVDPEEANVTFRYRWQRQTGVDTWETLVEASGVAVAALPPSGAGYSFAANDAIRLEIEPYDGVEYGAVVTIGPVAIGNNAPVLSGALTIQPASPDTTDALTLSAQPTVTDIDDPAGNDTSLAYVWERQAPTSATWLPIDDAEARAEVGDDAQAVADLPARLTDRDYSYRVRVTPYDGIATGQSDVSNALTVGNTAPVADADTFEMDERDLEADGLVIGALELLADDSDVDGLDQLVVADVFNGQDTALEVTRAGDGTVSSVKVKPAIDFYGSVSFSYTISDGDLEHTAEVTLTVNNTPDSPTAVGDSASVDEDSVDNPILALTNDEWAPDPEEILSLTGVGSATYGIATIDGDRLLYTPNAGVPNPDASQVDSFEYTITDEDGLTSTATVTVTINNVNDGPTAMDDTGLTTAEDTPLNIDVLANDTDPENDGLTLFDVQKPAHGDYTIEADGTVTYTPDDDYFGNDEFEYTATDGSLTSTASVYVEVTAVNDDPTLVANTGATVAEGGTLTFSNAELEIGDVDHAPGLLAIRAVSGPSHGTLERDGTAITAAFSQADITAGRITYVHDGGDATSDSFDFEASDDNDGVAEVSGIFNITITPFNDVPELTTNPVEADEAEHVTITDSELLATDSEAAGPADLEYRVVTLPTNGALGVGVVPGQIGSTFTQANVNAGHITYLHSGGDNTSDSFDLTVSDGTNVVPGTLTFEITPINDDPVLTASELSALEDQVVVISDTVLSASDEETTDPSQLVFTITSAPSAGAIEVDGVGASSFTQQDILDGDVAYRHDGSETTSDSFGLTVADGDTGTDTATVSVDIRASNDVPVAQYNPLEIDEDELASVTQTELSATDTDSDDGPDQLMYIILSGPAVGDLLRDGVVLEQSGTFTQADINAGLISYDHDGSHTTSDQVTFTVTDNRGTGTTSSQLDVLVTTSDDAPEFTNSALTVTEDATVVIDAGSLLGEDEETTDVSQLTFTVTSGPSHGELTVNGGSQGSFTQQDINGGLVSYAHDGSDAGGDSIGLTLADGTGQSTSGSLAITVNPVNDAPEIDTTPVALDEGETADVATANLSATDPDPAHGPEQLTYRLDGVLTNGALLLNATPLAQNGTFTQQQVDEGLVTYAHDGSHTSADSVALTLTDGIASPTLTLEFDITTTNDNPTATAGSITVDEGETQIFGSAQLMATDEETTSPADLEYIVSSYPANGFVRRDGFAVAKFTQLDVNQGLMAYEHDGSETTSDQIGLVIKDPDGGQGSGGTLQITVNPVIDPLQLDLVTLVLDEAATAPIGSAQILATDAENGSTPDELIYTVLVAPTAGDLLKGTDVLAAEDTFSQADVNAGSLSYRHDGTNYLNDEVELRLTDVEGVTTTGVLNFSMNQINDDPIATTSPLTLDEGATARVRSPEFEVTDEEGVNLWIVTIDTPPTHGEIQVRDALDRETPTPPASSFTRQQWRQLLVVYVHDGGESTSDSFEFTVTDEDGGTDTGTFEFEITPVNDLPEITGTLEFDADEGADTPITSAILSATDAETDDSTLTFSVTLAPSTGEIRVGGSVSSSFTMADLTAGDVIYRNDGEEPSSVDWFDVRVSDGEAQVNGRVNITILEVNDPPVAGGTLTHSLAEDAATWLDRAVLTSTDPDDGLDARTFVIQSGPANGEIQVRDTTDRETPTPAVTSFTQADVDAFAVYYVPDADFNGSDSLTVRLEDSEGAQADVQTVAITISPANDPPQLIAASTAVEVNEGMTVAFTGPRAVSVTDDAGEIDADFNIHVFVSPARGTIHMTVDEGVIFDGAQDTNELNLLGPYSQVQPALATLEYTAPSDLTVEETVLMRVRVNDLDNYGSGFSPQAIEDITITLIPDPNAAPVVSISTTPVDEGGSVSLRDGLSTSDGDHGPTELTYNLIALPGEGELIIGASTVATLSTTFTEQQVQDGDVRYQHDGDESEGSDSFQFEVEDDAGGTSGAQTMNFTVAAVNDAPAIALGTALIEPIEEVPFAFTGGNAFTVADDASSDGSDINVELDIQGTGAHGTLNIDDDSLVIAGTVPSEQFHLRGTPEEINAVLATLVYLSAPEPWSGDQQLVINVDDLGNTGSGAALGVSDQITIRHQLVNDAPEVDTTVMQVSEDDSAQFVSYVSLTDDDPASDLTYELVSLPQYGVLKVGTDPAELTTTWTHQSMLSTPSHVTYLQDGSEVSSDSVQFEVVDAAGLRSGVQTMNIEIELQNDQPQVAATVSSFDVDEGATHGFDGDTSISVVDDAASTDLVRVFVRVDNNSGTADMTVDPGLVIGGALGTKSIMLEGQRSVVEAALATLEYTAPDEVLEQRDISVRINFDDLGNTGVGTNLVGELVFTVTLNPVNDAPVVGTTAFGLDEGQWLEFHQNISVTDSDNANDELTYHLVSLPANGTVFLSATEVTLTTTWTQADLDGAATLSYDHDGSETTTDSFEFKVVDDGGLDSGTQTMSFEIAPLNDVPVLSLGAQELLARRGLTTDVTTDHFTTVDGDDGPEALTYRLIDSPDYGTLELDGVEITGSSSFTQADLEAGDITYVHGGSDQSDSFELQVEDPDVATDSLVVAVTLDSFPVIEEVKCGWRPVRRAQVVDCSAMPPVAGATVCLSVQTQAEGAGETVDFDWDGRGYSGASCFRTYDESMDVTVRVTDGNGDTDTNQSTISLAGDRPDGHLVVIGHDYTGTVPADAARLLVNSIYLSHAPDQINVVALRDYATADQITGVEAAIDSGDDASFSYRIPAASTVPSLVPVPGPEPSTFEPIGSGLDGVDVLLIYPMNGLGGSSPGSLGQAWRRDLDAFVGRGGVIVVVQGDDAATEVFLRGTSLVHYEADPTTATTLAVYSSAAHNDPPDLLPESSVVRGLSANTYPVFGSTVEFTLSIQPDERLPVRRLTVAQGGTSAVTAFHRFFGPRGQVVVVGTDATSQDDDLTTLLGNAVASTEASAGPKVRYAFWMPPELVPDAGQIQVMLDEYLYDHREGFARAADIMTSRLTWDDLDNVQVLVLPELTNPSGLDAWRLGFDLRGGHGGDVLGWFLARGGTILVLDDGRENGSGLDILAGAGLLDVVSSGESIGSARDLARPVDSLLRGLSAGAFSGLTSMADLSLLQAHAVVENSSTGGTAVARGLRPGCLILDDFEQYTPGDPVGLGGFPDGHWTTPSEEPNAQLVSISKVGGYRSDQGLITTDWWHHTSSSLVGRQPLSAFVRLDDPFSDEPAELYLAFGLGCGAAADGYGIRVDRETISSGRLDQGVWTELDTFDSVSPLSGNWTQVIVEPIDFGPDGAYVRVTTLRDGLLNGGEGRAVEYQATFFFPNAVGTACTWGGNVAFRGEVNLRVDDVQICSGMDQSLVSRVAESPAWAALQGPETCATDHAQMLGAIDYIRRDSDGYVAPTPIRATALAASVAGCLEGTADCVERAADAGYTVCGSGDDVLVWTPNDTTVGDAYFAVRTGDARPLILEAPHGSYDSDTDVQAIEMFDNLKTRAVIITGTHRCGSDTDSQCSGTTGACVRSGSAPYRVSDMAHATDSTFHTAHGVLSTRFRDSAVVSLHGMGDPGFSVSNGTKEDVAMSSPAPSLTRALETQFGGYFDELYPEGYPAEYPNGVITTCNDDLTGELAIDSRLCGTTNVQGRLLNSVVAVEACTIAAQEASERFIHFEQENAMRTNADNRALIECAFDEVFPFGECLEGCCER